LIDYYKAIIGSFSVSKLHECNSSFLLFIISKVYIICFDFRLMRVYGKVFVRKDWLFKEYVKARIVVNETINRSDIVVKAVNKFLLF